MTEALSIAGRSWTVAEGEFPVAGFAEHLLAQRHIPNIADFLYPTLKGLMPDPTLIPQITKAAERLADGIIAKEGITLLADFDVDGATSAALLFQYLAFYNLRPLVEVPERLTEGFGPNARILDSIVARGSDLVLCLDCGTAAVDLLSSYSNALQIMVVDHHQPEHDLPNIYAVVNPHCSAEGQTAFGDLAAVGVVFMLLVATNKQMRAAGHEVPDLRKFLDLVALGTVCDMVPMRGLNRAFVHHGLQLMNSAPSVGVAALMQVSGVKMPKARPEDLSFSLGPKLNAGSRQGFSSIPWQLLIESDPAQARQFALQLSRLNKKRKEDSISLAVAAQEVMQDRDGYILASNPNWPLGILGILAGRLSRRLHKPCFIIGYDADGVGSGSARSIAGVDLGGLLQGAVAEKILLRGGGHAMAGGFGLHRDQEADFLAFLDREIALMAQETPSVQVDGQLELKDCSINMLMQLQRLEPFGVGNAEPVFLLPKVRWRNAALMGTEHLRLEIIDDNFNRLSAVFFNEAQSKLGKFLLSHQGDAQLLVRLKPDFRFAGKVTAHIEDARLL